MRRVAITGFGVVSPIGANRVAFWEALTAGQSGIASITRFDVSTFEVRLAGEVKTMPSLPDAVAAVAADDPKVGFAFAAAAEALEEAGLAALDGETLLHLGTSLEIFDLRKVVDAGANGLPAFVDRLLANDRALQIPLDTANRLIADRFGRPAGSLTNCSACAAGIQAIGHGFHAVRDGRCEIAVCGGFDSMLNPLGVGGFQLLGALSTDNDRGEHACRPFDAARRGAVLGEGAAVVVMEPFERARAAGKEILAEVGGYASTLDAHSLTAPDPAGDGAMRAMRGALVDAGIEASRIGHLNAHGTGTRLNDAIEAAAIRAVFPDTWESIPVSATKCMTGHLIAAAGAVEIGACLLPLMRGFLPPNISLASVGRGCELNHVTAAGAVFSGEYAMTNSFGFGGQNASMVLRRV